MTMPGRDSPTPPDRYDPGPYGNPGAPTPPDGIPASIQYTEPVAYAEPTTGAPALPPGEPADSAPAKPPSAPAATPVKKHSRAGAAWVALVVAAVVMIFLLIFIVQNSDPVQVRYFGVEGTLPLGVAMLFAAIAGALTAGLLGTVRILQLRARARRAAAG